MNMMDIKIIIGTLIMGMILIFAIALIILQRQKNKKKNTIGFKYEAKINNQLSHFAKQQNWEYIPGGLFKYANTQQFEIDGFLLAPYALYVIESKYFVGHLEGSALSKEIDLVNNKKKKKMKNPVLQNFKHIQHLYKMLGFNFNAFSLVILPQDTTFKLTNNESWSIIENENTYEKTILEISSEFSKEENLTTDQMIGIREALNLARCNSLRKMKKFQRIVSQNEE